MVSKPEKPQELAFTAEFDRITHEIILPCGVSLPFSPTKNPGTGPHPTVHKMMGLWDTGATGSVITANTAQLLSLVPTGKTKVFHVKGETIENVYLVNIYLPNQVVIPNVRVTECHDTNGRFGLIIGMDIITRGDFAITNINQKTTLSFRMPSVKTIDFVPNNKPPTKVEIKKEIKTTKGPSLNAPCPCGSGKKYKRCCGKTVTE